jgi:hypothetical protein
MWQPVLPGANVSLDRWLPAPARMVCEQLLQPAQPPAGSPNAANMKQIT